MPEDDRPHYPHDDPELDKKLTRNLIRDDRTVSRTVKHRDRVYSASATAETDFETAMHWRKCDIAEQRRRTTESHERFAEAEARHFTCAACGTVRAPSFMDNAGVMTRPLPGGLGAVHLCGRCAVVAERVAVDALKAERVGGNTRAELVAAVLAEPLSNVRS